MEVPWDADDPIVWRRPIVPACLMRPKRPVLAVDKITLDRETFKALASDTRLDILKALDVRQKTVTELAKELDLNKATVFEHLEKLAAVNLIQKLEDERKWVYWQLTWTGRRLLHPEKITLALALSSAGASLVTALVAAFLWLRSALPQASGTSDKAGAEAGRTAAPQGASSLATPPPGVEPAQAVAHDPVLLAAAFVLGILFLSLVAYAAWVWRRGRTSKSAPATP